MTRRTKEIGLRMALGARPGNVVARVLWDGMKLAGAGILIGLAGASVLTRVLRSKLFGIDPTDVATFIVVTLLLIMVALLACWLPARRAARIDPMVALRNE